MLKKTIFQSPQIITPKQPEKGYLVMANNKIEGFYQDYQPCFQKFPLLNFNEHTIMPGFIDLHIHGGGGYSVSDDPADIFNLCHFLAKNGITGFYPTVTALPWDQLSATINAINQVKKEQRYLLSQQQKTGALIWGIHLEGPFLNPQKTGALNAKELIPFNELYLQKLLLLLNSTPLRITVAPEIDTSGHMIPTLIENNVTVAAGHTVATAQELQKSIKQGIKIINHLFNAMKPFHHREVGAVGLSLIEDTVFVEIIADGIHVHPYALEIAYRCKGLAKLILISDAISAANLPPGDYLFDNKKITINHQGQSTLENGVIAGSTCLMNQGFKNIVKFLKLSCWQAAQITAQNPALAMGIAQQTGSIKQGLAADLIILDSDNNVQEVFIHGIKNL